MLSLYQSVIRSVVSEDVSRNVREGPLSMIMGSKYTSSNTGSVKLINFIRDKQYIHIKEGSNIGYTSSYLHTISSIPIVQFIGINIEFEKDHWKNISLSLFNSRVPLIPINFEDKENMNNEEWSYILFLILVPKIEVYIATLRLNTELISFIKSTAVQPSKILEKNNYVEVYEHLVDHGIGLYHTPGCQIEFTGYVSYEFFNELNLIINKKDESDMYKIGEWDNDMLIYKINKSQKVDNQDVTEQVINGDKYMPSLLIIKIKVNIENQPINESSKHFKYYLIPDHILRMFKINH